VWLLSLLNVLSLLDGSAYDHLVQLSPGVSQSAARVLLVESELDHLEGGEDLWLKLLQTLEQQGAQQIVFPLSPRRVSRQFYQEAARYGNVVFGRTVVADPDDPETARLAPLPHAAEDLALHWGCTQVPPSSSGVHRSQSAVCTGTETHDFALEILAALLVLGQQDSLPQTSYLVNFNGGAGRLPRITFDHVVSGGLVPELVQERTVIVGLSASAGLPGLHTPLTTGQEMMSILEFHGFALDTLLMQAPITTMSPVTTLILLLLIAFVGLFTYQWMNLRTACWFTLSTLVIFVVIAWGVLAYALVWLPVVEMGLTQILLFLSVSREKAVMEDLAIQKMQLDLSVKLRERLFPASFYDFPDYWPPVITVVSHLLELKRTIFLQRVKNDHRVREVKALHCSIDDIHERRRDYTREPYRTAISENGPIHVEAYLKVVDTPEVQYLMPLIFAGEVLGFWAFGIDPAKAAAMPMFTSIVKSVGSQIGEMLYHRQQWLRRNEARANSLQRYLSLEGREPAYRQLNKSVTLLERRLGVLEGVLQGLETATILYDLFGRVLHVNKPMTDLLKAAGLAIYDMTALAFVAALTGIEAAQAQRFMRYLILEQGTLTLPVSFSLQRDRTYVLHLRGLGQADDSAVVELGEVQPFQLQGILCELIDVTDLKQRYQWKEKLTENLSFQVRSDLESVLLAAQLLWSGQLAADQQWDVLELLQTKVKNTVATLKEAQKHLNLDPASETMERYPIDARQLLLTAIEEVKEAAAAGRTEVKANLPELQSLVFAAPDALKVIFDTLLTFLLQDVVEGGTVTIDVEERNHWVTYAFANTGFGLPNERFQEYLSAEAEPPAVEFKRLHEAMRQVQLWEGTLQAASEVGIGTRFQLQLKGFV
jgi:CHASE2 domain-containing sensor protein